MEMKQGRKERERKNYRNRKGKGLRIEGVRGEKNKKGRARDGRKN